MSETNAVLKMWQRMAPLPMGSWLFSRVICRKAPYFGSVSPHVTRLEPGRCEVLLRKRTAVQNHIGTVHVIAICNALEMAMGVMAEASIPSHLRWIPKGMEVRYPAKGPTDITAIASVDRADWQPGDLAVTVRGVTADGVAAVEGTIWLWISEKPAKKR